MADKEEAIEVQGTVIEMMRGTQFKVQLQNGHVILAHISGKMRKNNIKIILGYKGRVEMSPYDVTKGRITYREKLNAVRPQ